MPDNIIHSLSIIIGSMLEQLFGSKTRLKILKAFYRNSEKLFFVRELARDIDSQINAVRREIETLTGIGLLKEVVDEEKKKIARKNDAGKSGVKLRKYYILDRACPIFAELQSLLLKENLLGEQEFVKSIEDKVGDVKMLVLSGRFTNDMKAPTDLLVVGDIKESVLSRLVNKYEKDFGVEVRFTIMTAKEFSDRRYVMDKFLYSIFDAQHLKAVDKITE